MARKKKEDKEENILFNRPKVKFINNDPADGLAIDWEFIRKEYNKLGCPDTVYDPTVIPFERCKHNILLSERSLGKTTNLLLLGMLLFIHYGVVIQYIRSSEEMIMNKNTNELFTTIRDYHYIDKLTDGKYNDCIYKARKWHFCKVDQAGEVVEICPEHFMFCLSIDKSEYYKSSYNAPRGDFIIYDEFIGKRYRLNEFVYFADLLKTIIRDRLSPVVVWLANTIDLHSEYYEELEIYEDVQLLEIGQYKEITTERGTKIYIELLGDRKEKKRKEKVNNFFFGFRNPRLASITGGGWATESYPHMDSKYEVVYRGIYIEYHNKLLALDIVAYDDIGYCINCHKASRLYDDSIVYSLSEPKDKRYRYYMGEGDKLDRLICRLVNSHKIRFQNNACGTIFFNHYNQKDAKKR